MASRCCGNRLSLPNQYDTKTPRESHVGGRQEAALFQGCSSPVRDLARDRLASRIRCTAWVSKCPWRNLSNFGKEIFRKISLRSTPDRRTLPFEPQPSPRKRNTHEGQAASRPQVQVPLPH